MTGKEQNYYLKLINLMKKIRYSIIGCGAIAGGYGNKQKINGVYTHVEALSKIKIFQPMTCLDLIYKKALKFKKKFGFQNASSNLNILNKVKNELIIVSADTSAHYNILNKILKIRNKPKIVLCEKPLTTNKKQCLEIYNKFNKKKIILAVNFNRRWDETIKKIKRDIQNNLYGKFRVGYCLYNKGLLNTCSHVIDLMNLFFRKIKVIYVGKKIYDYDKSDPSVPFIINTEDGDINFLCSDNQDSNMLEIKLIFSKKIIETCDGGMSWVIKDNKDKNILSYDFSFYDYKKNLFKKTYKYAFLNLAKNMSNSIRYKKKILCSGKEALYVHTVINKILLDAK
jgi:predicted dehydrogenase